MRIHTGDTVVVITGKDKGKTGSVLRVLAAKNRLVIGGVNMRTKHVRATPQRAGQKIQYEASIHVSNVMLIDPKSKKRTRIGYVRDEKGKKRIAKRSGETLAVRQATKVKATKAKDEKAASSSAKASEDKKEEKVTKKEDKGIKEVKETAVKKSEKQVSEKVEAPVKKPFWKRMMSFGEDAAQEAEEDTKQSDHSISKETPPHRKSSSRGS